MQLYLNQIKQFDNTSRISKVIEKATHITRNTGKTLHKIPYEDLLNIYLKILYI